MNFDPLFEDLEARFSASEAIANQGFSLAELAQATSIELVLQNGSRQTLIAPVLGQSFVAGVNPDSPNWLVVPLKAIRSMGFVFDSTPSLPALQISQALLHEHLELLPLPAKCNFRTLSPDEGLIHATLLGIAQGLLFLQLADSPNLRAVALEQVTQLQIWAVDNLSEDL